MPASGRLRWWGLSAAFVIIFSFWLNTTHYALGKYSGDWSCNPPSVRVRILAPVNVSADEDEEIILSVENIGTDSVDVAFQLVNHGSSLNFPSSAGNNSFYSGPVAPREYIYRQMKVFFPSGVNQIYKMRGKPIGLSVLGCIPNTRDQTLELELPIRIAPIPRTRLISNYLGAVLVGLVIWLAKELWNLLATRA
jgi:hypothetical protein